MAIDDTRPDRREALFGGEGAVLVWDLLGARAAPPFSAVLYCELEPGGRVGAHRQEHFPEIVVGISGQGEALVDGAHHPLRAGDVVHLPLGATLAIHNGASEEPLCYLIVKAREGH
jgi:quercetin dioxygenase-like cupin family protein